MIRDVELFMWGLCGCLVLLAVALAAAQAPPDIPVVPAVSIHAAFPTQCGVHPGSVVVPIVAQRAPQPAQDVPWTPEPLALWVCLP